MPKINELVYSHAVNPTKHFLDSEKLTKNTENYLETEPNRNKMEQMFQESSNSAPEFKRHWHTCYNNRPLSIYQNSA